MANPTHTNYLPFQRLGKVLSREPFTVQWLDDDTCDEIDLSCAPANLAAMCEEQWFLAMVRLDRTQDKVIRILSVEATEPFDGISDAEANEPPLGLGDLPRLDWDEI